MENKKRNKKILELTCELLEKLNCEISKAAVEDISGEEAQVLVSVEVTNPALLIGFKGKNLAAIQLVLALIVKNSLGEWVRVNLDINKYRDEQKERLTRMVNGLVDKVIATGKPVAMASMSSYERRLCHMIATERPEVITESEGEGEDRHIVIKLKD